MNREIKNWIIYLVCFFIFVWSASLSGRRSALIMPIPIVIASITYFMSFITQIYRKKIFWAEDAVLFLAGIIILFYAIGNDGEEFCLALLFIVIPSVPFITEKESVRNFLGVIFSPHNIYKTLMVIMFAIITICMLAIAIHICG